MAPRSASFRTWDLCRRRQARSMQAEEATADKVTVSQEDA